MRIVLTGGGTGGHIFPLVVVAREIRKKIGAEAELLFIGPKGKLEEETMAKENIPVKFISVGKARRYFSVQNFLDFFKAIAGVIKSLWLLLVWMPDVVFSKGGYASVPVVIAAWLYHIPILIHESDAIPGVANKILGKLAKRIAVSYPSARDYFEGARVALTGNPLREEMLGGNSEEARKKFQLSDAKPVIFVTGGSQGAMFLNEAIVNILPQLLHKYQIIHQTGENNLEEVVRAAGVQGIKAGKDGYIATPFLQIEELRDALAVADLVISRAGSDSISTIAAYGKPSIIIPLPTAANNHQQMNAYKLAEIGAALVLEEGNLGPDMFLERIETLMNNAELKKNMGEKIKVFYHPDAAEKIVEGLLGICVDRDNLTPLKVWADEGENKTL